MASINSPQITNAIRTDVPAINAILKALAKADPSLLSDIENGTKRFYEGTSGWEFQELIDGTWTTHTNFNIDAQSVDGYNSSIDAVANTIVVRDANGKLKGNLTGKADTAGTADNLASTLAVNAGGTGATKAEDARTNLGVPPTNHASTTTTYGVSSATQYGHPMASSTTPKADGTAAVGSETSKFARGDHVHPQLVASASVRGDVILSDSASASQTAATGHAATPAAVATAVATVDSKFGNYLPLSGGTMTGPIRHNNVDTVLRAATNGGQTRISGGVSGWNDGGIVTCYGVGSPNNPGGVYIAAMQPGTSGSKSLIMKYDLEAQQWRLDWGNDAVLTSAGGAMTGSINSTSDYAINLVRSAGQAIVARAEFTVTGDALRFGIGGSGNRGIYDEKLETWLINFDSTGELRSKGLSVLTGAKGLLLNNSNVQVVDVGNSATVTAPSGGTWRYFAVGHWNSQNVSGVVAGGGTFQWPNSGHGALVLWLRVS